MCHSGGQGPVRRFSRIGSIGSAWKLACDHWGLDSRIEFYVIVQHLLCFASAKRDSLTDVVSASRAAYKR
jgi:hypothetical protein